VPRQSDGERGALTDAIAARGDAAAMQFNQLFADRESEAKAAVLACEVPVGLAERFEDVGKEPACGRSSARS
jgi:hypothetical protein